LLYIDATVFNAGSIQPTCNRKVVLVKILSRGIRKDKGERGTIETEMKAENGEETCMVIPMQEVIDSRPKKPLSAKRRSQ
jgi:hypothetical protein